MSTPRQGGSNFSGPGTGCPEGAPRDNGSATGYRTGDAPQSCGQATTGQGQGYDSLPSTPIQGGSDFSGPGTGRPEGAPRVNGSATGYQTGDAPQSCGQATTGQDDDSWWRSTYPTLHNQYRILITTRNSLDKSNQHLVQPYVDLERDITAAMSALRKEQETSKNLRTENENLHKQVGEVRRRNNKLDAELKAAQNERDEARMLVEQRTEELAEEARDRTKGYFDERICELEEQQQKERRALNEEYNRIANNSKDIRGEMANQVNAINLAFRERLDEINNTLAELGDVRDDLYQNMYDWQKMLYCGEYRELAYSYLDLRDRVGFLSKLECEWCDRIDPELAAELARQRGGVETLHGRMEKALADLGLCTFMPQPGDPLDPYRHAYDYGDEPETDDLVIESCIKPGIERVGPDDDKRMVVIKANVKLRGLGDDKRGEEGGDDGSKQAANEG